MSRSSKEAERYLFDLVRGQGGYFTAKQAAELGYGPAHLTYHVQQGNFERVDHGLYRVSTWSRAEQDQLIRLSFWSRNRRDEPQAVISHETALTLHGLSDLLPERIDLTVPPRFQKPTPTGCVLRRAILTDADIEVWEGFRITTVRRTLLDVARAGTVQEQLDRAMLDALRLGTLRRSEAMELAQNNERLRQALASTKR